MRPDKLKLSRIHFASHLCQISFYVQEPAENERILNFPSLFDWKTFKKFLSIIRYALVSSFKCERNVITSEEKNNCLG